MKYYKELLELKVFNLEDVFNLTKNINNANKLIKSLLDANLIKRVKKNLYVVCDIENSNVIANQYMIASKIKDDSYICYHSALEYFGVKNQIFYEVYVSTKKRFQNFEFDGYNYKFINCKKIFGVILQGKVRVTDRERTFIDCINRTEMAGGDEELLLCLELFGKLDGKKILEYLKYYNSKKLYAKVGFMLELLNDVFGVDEKVISECNKKINIRTYYFDNETMKSDNKYISNWKLIVPKIFVTRGGTLNW